MHVLGRGETVGENVQLRVLAARDRRARCAAIGDRRAAALADGLGDVAALKAFAWESVLRRTVTESARGGSYY